MTDWPTGPGGRRPGIWLERKEAVPKQPPAPETPKAPAEDWIKIRVVDDQSGKAIEKVILDLKTPDGHTEQHTTRLSGEIESLGLQSGNCEVSCDLKDATIESTLPFVVVGENPIGEKGTDTSNSSSKAANQPGTKYIASIEEHKVKSGETLKSIADSAGMTWQALARFNWGTDEPEKVNENLHWKVGCTKKTADGNNYVFDDADNPGILYVPKKWIKDGLATNQIHTIRVNKVPLAQDYADFELVDVFGNPYTDKIKLKPSDGDAKEHTLSSDGHIRVVDLSSGTITFEVA